MVAIKRRGAPHGPEDRGGKPPAGSPGTPPGASRDTDQRAAAPPARIAVPAGLIPPGERPLLVLKPHWWFLFLRTPWQISGLLIIVVVALGLEVSRLAPAVSFALPMVWWGAGVALLVLVFVNILRRHVRWYVLTDARVVRVGGVLRRVRVEIPAASVRMLATDEPVVQRIAGVGAVLFGSAATGGVEVVWTFVESPARVSASVRAHLAASGNTRPAQAAGPGASK